MDDKELFNAATSDEVATVETPADTPETVDQPRDEHGRFAPKASEPEAEQVTPQPEPAAQPEPQEAQVPSWRLREEREAREAAESRYREAQAHFQRQMQELQSRV